MGRFFGPVPNIISAAGFFRGSGAAGHTWTQVITGFEAAAGWFSVSFANGLFLITANSSPVSSVVRSSDLVTFTSHNIAAAALYNPTSVVFGAGTYFTALHQNPVAFGVLGYTSPDLVTWTLQATGFPLNFANGRVFLPVFGNGVFLLVSQGSAAYATSPDGATWTQQSTYVPTNWGQPVFDGTRFAATVIGVSATPKIATSLDGINWTESAATLDANFSGGSIPLFVGNHGTSQYVAGQSTNDAGDSLNGALTSVTAFTFNDSGGATGSTPVFSGSSWARTDTLSSRIVSSANGLAWSQDTVPAVAHAWSNVAFGAGAFAVIGTDTGGNNLLATRGP